MILKFSDIIVLFVYVILIVFSFEINMKKAILILECCGNYICRECLYKFIAKNTQNKTELCCPLCMNTIKGVSDVDPKQKIKFYSDNAEEIYSWYMKKKDDDIVLITEGTQEDTHKNKSFSSLSLEEIEIHEISGFEVKPKKSLEQCMNEIRPRTLDFAFCHMKTPLKQINEIELTPDSEDNEDNIHSNSINEYSSSKRVYDRMINSERMRKQSCDIGELEEIHENSSINIPKSIIIKLGCHSKTICNNHSAITC